MHRSNQRNLDRRVIRSIRRAIRRAGQGRRDCGGTASFDDDVAFVSDESGKENNPSIHDDRWLALIEDWRVRTKHSWQERAEQTPNSRPLTEHFESSQCRTAARLHPISGRQEQDHDWKAECSTELWMGDESSCNCKQIPQCSLTNQVSWLEFYH